ncbi:Pkinase-domain-containing protein [Panus rudis PR-1116 ss-1]|nr:Pkinase-domain-containing protein [Panus rudis PR-1116 ss-1]
MYSLPKRPAPEEVEDRPNKRQATSSPEEGELEDATPPPPRRSPTPPGPPKPTTASKKAPLPFPFKKKNSAQNGEPPESNAPRNGPAVLERPVDDERMLRDRERDREEDDRRVRSRRYEPRAPYPSNVNNWVRQDSWQPRRDYAPPEPINDHDRHYLPRNEPERWDPPRDSPRYACNRRQSSRSLSRSRTPPSPASSGREKHRLPPPRSPDSYSYGRGHSDRRNGRSRRLSKSSWEGDSYVPRDSYPPADRYDDYARGRDRWPRDDEPSRTYERDRDRMDSYRPMSPRSTTPQRPYSPMSIANSQSDTYPSGLRSPPPPPDVPPPPPPPEQDKPVALPEKHDTVRISLPKKPPTPANFSPPRGGRSLLETRPPTKSEIPPKETPQPPRVHVQRQKRQPVHRTREEELALYGRIFEGCGRQEDYDVMTKLGEGTFGEVHKAVHIKKGHAVALKRILMHNEKEGMPVTALREIKILKALKHPCIIDILDMFVMKSKGKESPLSVYMVFPYMDHDLAGLLENERVKLTPSQIKLYMKQLLEGTEYMHRNHILHRDMKAANLLISNNGSLKIADFGLARSYDPDIVKGPSFADGVKDDRRMKKYTNCVVTRWYRPPELLLGARQYGGEVDMWGIGCVLGEMFHRRPILPGSSDLDQLDKIWQLCGTPNQHTWPDYDTLPGCEGVKRFQTYVRRLRQNFEAIGPETVDLLDKLLICNPRERLTASQALDHDYFWTDPLPADPKSLPSYEASHEFDKRGRRQVPHGPPVPPPHIESLSRPLPMPTQPPPLHFGGRPPLRPGPPPPTGIMPPFNNHNHHNNRHPPPMPPQQLPPLKLRPGQPPPMFYPMPMPPVPGMHPQPPPGFDRPSHLPQGLDRSSHVPPGFDRPSHLPPRPMGMPMPPMRGGPGGGPNGGGGDRRNGYGGGGGGGGLNYG